MLNAGNEKYSKISKLQMGVPILSVSDSSEAFQVFALSRPPSVPVLGRRLSSESIITMNEEFSSRYPYAVHVSEKKNRRKSNPSNLDQKIPLKKKIIQIEEKLQESVHEKKISKVGKVSQKRLRKKTSVSIADLKVKRISSKSHLTKSARSKTPEKRKSIKTLVHKSLKKHKKSKKEIEVNKTADKEKKEKHKKDIEEFNKIARVENYNRFKHKLFKPSIPWGVDEKRVKKSKERKKDLALNSNTTPPKRHFRVKPEKIRDSSPEESSSKRCQHKNDPEVKKYLKLQKKIRKKSKEREEEVKLEKENKRISQLKYLDIISRHIVDKPKHVKKKVKPKKTLNRCPEVKWMNADQYSKSVSDKNEEVKSFEGFSLNSQDELQGGRHFKAFGNFEKYEFVESSDNLTSIANEILSKKAQNEVELPKVSTSMPESIDSESCLEKPVISEREQKKKSKNLIQNRLNGRFEELKAELNSIQAANEAKIREKAAIKIQACVRGFLTRKAFKNYYGNIEEIQENSISVLKESNSWMYKKKYPDSFDSFVDEDEEVKKILCEMNHESSPLASARFPYQDSKEEIYIDNTPIGQKKSEISSFSAKSYENIQKKNSSEEFESIVDEDKHAEGFRSFEVIEKFNEKFNEKSYEKSAERSYEKSCEKSYEIMRKVNPSQKGALDKNLDSISSQNQAPKFQQNSPKIQKKIKKESPERLVSKGFASLANETNSKEKSVAENLGLGQFERILLEEQKNFEMLEQESKEIQSMLGPESLKFTFKEELEILRNRDLDEIKQITPESGSEPEIVKIFQDIINRRYENISHMFEENIKAVKEALCASVIQEEKSIIETIELKKGRNEENCDELDVLLKQMIGTQHIREIEDQILKDYENQEIFSDHESEEVNAQGTLFPQSPSPCTSVNALQEPIKHLNYLDEILGDDSSHLGSNIVSPNSQVIWVNEVAVLSNTEFSNILVDSTLSYLEEIILSEITDLACVISAEEIANLSESILYSLLVNEVSLLNQALKASMSEETIIKIIEGIIYSSELNLVEKLNRPPATDYVDFLSKMQESEIGTTNFPEKGPPIISTCHLQQNGLSLTFKKLIFDAINECLEILQNKEDLPWNYNRTPKVIYSDNAQICEAVKNLIVLWNNSRTGKILNAETFLASKFNEEAISRWREEKMLKVLAQEISLNELKWVVYDFEESQLKLDLADMALESLVEEVITIARNI